MLLILLSHGGHIGLSKTIDFPSANEMRTLTEESIEIKTIKYLEEYTKFFIEAINNRALNGHYYYTLEGPEWMDEVQITALNLLCDRFVEQGYRVEKKITQQHNSNFFVINKITVYWN